MSYTNLASGGMSSAEVTALVISIFDAPPDVGGLTPNQGIFTNLVITGAISFANDSGNVTSNGDLSCHDGSFAGTISAGGDVIGGYWSMNYYGNFSTAGDITSAGVGTFFALVISGGINCSMLSASTVVTGVFTVASLVSGVPPVDGLRAFVSDALAPVFGSAVVGGGSVHVPVYYSSGTSTWRVG